MLRRCHRIDQHLPVTHQLLRGLRIVPQVRILNAGIEFLKPIRCGFHIQTLAQQVQRFFNLDRRSFGFLRASEGTCMNVSEGCIPAGRSRKRCISKATRDKRAERRLWPTPCAVSPDDDFTEPVARRTSSNNGRSAPCQNHRQTSYQRSALRRTETFGHDVVAAGTRRQARTGETVDLDELTAGGTWN